MKERPVIFSGPMVRAILEYLKTQTRQIMASKNFRLEMCELSDPPHLRYSEYDYRRGEGLYESGSGPFDLTDFSEGGSQWHAATFCPYGVAGDRLWAITIKPIQRNPRYGAGDDGCIYRIDKPLPSKMRSAPTGKGYHAVTLCEHGKRKTELVHLLVCEAFYGPKPAIYDEARHLDGDRTNNAPQNLDWGTRQQNWSDRRFKGRGVRSKHWAAKISEEQAADIRNSVFSQRVLAKKYGLSQSTIGLIKQGNIWNPTPAQSEPPNMPRWASRITLEITKVRVERLQDISEEDAKAEGVHGPMVELSGIPYAEPLPKRWNARLEFRRLWDSLHGKGAWEKNPWAWVVEFRRLP